MKIQVLSDLHLEFEDFNIPELDSDIIILAGDIHTRNRAPEWILRQTKKPVIYVPGNHEYYRETFGKTDQKLADLCHGTNIHFLQNDSVTIDGVKFIGSTLWTDFNLDGNPRNSGQMAEYCMSDYRLIRCPPSYRKLNSSDTVKFHQKAISYIESEIKNSDRCVVITHHAPSPKSLSSDYVDSELNSAYASDLEWMMKGEPKLWIHGHVHNFNDYEVADTRVISNPRGYPGERDSFRPDFVVEI